MYFFRVGILKLFKQNGKMGPRISLYTQLEKLVKWQDNEEKAKEVKIKAQEYAQWNLFTPPSLLNNELHTRDQLS